MSPYLGDGDYLLLRPARKGFCFGRSPRPGDVIAYTDATGRLLVKRVLGQHSDGSYRVGGDSIHSTPAVDLGPVNPEQIRGRMAAHIRPKTPHTPT